MADVGKGKSIVRLGLELVEESIVLVFLELKLAAVEIKRKVHAAEKGAVLIAAGAGLLLFALITLTGAAVAALATVLPLWLSALIVTAVLAFFGIVFLFSGLGLLKDFSLVPADTLQRIEVVAKKLKEAAHGRSVAVGSAHPMNAPGSGSDSTPHN
ncbi:MAG TPA: phage holin family protein [Geomonas sp.]